MNDELLRWTDDTGSHDSVVPGGQCPWKILVVDDHP